MKRQGDLLIIYVKKIPKQARLKMNRILAEGEATGHFHQLTGGDVYEDRGTLYFRVGDSTAVTLTHPEHRHITFEAGIYKVIRQREYEPKGWRYVSD